MESWFLVPYVERTLLKKDTDKLYTTHHITTNHYKPVVFILQMVQGELVEIKIPIKRIRSKSVFLAKPLKKGQRVTIMYEYYYGSKDRKGSNY